jgi:replicative DNA helicase
VRRDLVPIHHIMGEVVDRIDYLARHRGEVLGVPTGFRLLDKVLGGLQKSDLIILAARPSAGKTSLALNLAANAVKKYHQRVAFFSLEMSNEQLVQRMLASETGIDQQRLRLGDIHDDEWPVLMEAAGVLANTPLFIDDTPAVSALEMRTKARRLHAEHGLDLVVVDYLQLMRGTGNRNENRVQEISYISRALKELARELKVPVVALSQLSRAVEQRADHRPVLSDLRESGCLAGSSLVYLPDHGRYVPISDLAGTAGFRVLGLNTATWKLEPSLVTNAFCTGRKAIYRMVTRLGRTVRATANHRFLTIGGWMRLDELEVGDRIALPRRLVGPDTQTISDAKLALLGHLIGDGCTLPRHAIQYTTRESDLAHVVASLALSAFGSEVEPRIQQEKDHTWYQVFIPATRHLTHGVRNPVSEWLISLGAFGLRSHEKRVPQEIFAQPSEAIAVFLRHLWATDGCIKMRAGKSPYPMCYYASSSRQLAFEVQSMLLRLGINARVKQMAQNGKGLDQFHVLISGRSDLVRFVDRVGTVGRYKTESMEEVVQFLSGRQENTNRDVIPKDIWQAYVQPAMRNIGMTHRAMHTGLDMNYAGMTLFTQNVSRERAARVARVVQSDILSQLAESDVYWDQLVAVQPDGVEEVFDLTVAGLHNFVADNIIVHNSIEQDADIVMFVHREDMYDANTERKNIADILVAKHRNGPTGTVSLYFRKELTLFTDLEVVREHLEPE